MMLLEKIENLEFMPTAIDSLEFTLVEEIISDAKDYLRQKNDAEHHEKHKKELKI